MVIAGSKELRAFERLLYSAPLTLADTLRQVRYNHAIDVLTRDIDELASASGKPASDPRRVATELLALLAGWFHLESMIRAIAEHEAIAFGERAVDLLLAASEAW
jgi:hypothetical protein